MTIPASIRDVFRSARERGGDFMADSARRLNWNLTREV